MIGQRARALVITGVNTDNNLVCSRPLTLPWGPNAFRYFLIAAIVNHNSLGSSQVSLVVRIDEIDHISHVPNLLNSNVDS
jgi:hypothetical protein